MQVLVVLIWLVAAINGVNVAIIVVIELGLVAVEMIELVVRFSSWTEIAHTLTFLLCAVPFGMFLVRANKNARTLTTVEGRELAGTGLARFTPASMVWWFFVPVLNFVRPFQALKVVWSASAREAAQRWRSEGDYVLSWWWGAWVVGSLLGSAASAAARAKVEPTTNNILLALQSLAWIATCAAAIQMLRALERRQATRAKELAGRR